MRRLDDDDDGKKAAAEKDDDDEETTTLKRTKDDDDDDILSSCAKTPRDIPADRQSHLAWPRMDLWIRNHVAKLFNFSYTVSRSNALRTCPSGTELGVLHTNADLASVYAIWIRGGIVVPVSAFGDERISASRR